MGIWDAIKSVANMVTGGGATLSLTLGQRSSDGSFPVKVKAVIADSDLKVEKVYLKVEGVETIKFMSKSHATSQISSKPATNSAFASASASAFASASTSAPTSAFESSEHEETDTNYTYTQETDFAPGGTLSAKKEYEWEGKFSVPVDAQPTFVGKKAKHEWRVYAALSVTGTDPSSSWATFVIR